MHRMRNIGLNKNSCVRIVRNKEKREQLRRSTCSGIRDKDLHGYRKKIAHTCSWRVDLYHHELMRFIYSFIYLRRKINK